MLSCALLLAASVVAAGLAVAMVAFSLWASNANPEVPADTPLPDLDEMRRHILWHAVYANPDDPRGWVPKTSGYGWTVNFRTRRNAAIFLGLVTAGAASAVVLLAVALSL